MNKKKQILIVEDNEINQEIISSILENDFNVLKANDGLEALKIIKDKRNSISLIMTDVNMPNMNGYELLDEIKKDPQYSLIPTIVLTISDKSKISSQSFCLVSAFSSFLDLLFFLSKPVLF